MTRLSGRFRLSGCGLSSLKSMSDDRWDEADDRGGVIWVKRYSDVGSPYWIFRGVFSNTEWVPQGFPG